VSKSKRVAVPLAILLTLSGCGRSAGPEDVALAYGRALYANDGDAIWNLASERDHRAKDRATFRRQHQIVDGFPRELLAQLGEYVTATPVTTTIQGDRGRVTLKVRLPDANAKAISDLVHGWDEKALNELPADARRRIRAALEELHRNRALPIVEGEESFDLVRERAGWRMSLNWAEGVRITFAAVYDGGLPLRIAIDPASATVVRGERLRVTLSVTNTGDREVETRVRHRTAPESASSHLALLHCPLLIPVRLAAGETREFVSEYVLLADSPEALKSLGVTYTFPGRMAAGATR
jgi:hypothetical protein